MGRKRAHFCDRVSVLFNVEGSCKSVNKQYKTTNRRMYSWESSNQTTHRQAILTAFIDPANYLLHI